MPFEESQDGIDSEKKDVNQEAAATKSMDVRLSSTQEARLFHSLNQFVGIVSNDSKSEAPEQSTVGGKHVANFLRLNLLSYLRQLQQHTHRFSSHREVLIQWWVTLLNFLNSDLTLNSSQSETTSSHLLTFPHPFLSLETVSVALECISRLMSTLMILPMHDSQTTEVYSHHILLTIHYVTNRLILNSKYSRQETNTQNPSSSRHFLHFLNSYSILLRSFLGKLNAYAFFYLPDDFHYDTQVLLAITPDLTFQENIEENLFTWKKRFFELTEDSEQRINLTDLENQDTRFFKIVVSYMKNDSVFMAFYWHYWYIVLRFVKFSNTFENVDSHLNAIPGASVLIGHVTSSLLKKDLNRFIKFIKSAHLNKGSSNVTFNATDSMPDSTAETSDNFVTSEAANEFVFSSFSILRLWESLRSLSGCFADDHNMFSLLSLHDCSQLAYIEKIPAHDCNLANVIYNKILQFMVFQFNSSSFSGFIHWDSWCLGISAMLRTMSGNCQVVALICLFNNWLFLPTEFQKRLTTQLLDEFWSSLTLECDFQLPKIILFKLLVFRIVPSSDIPSRQLLKAKLQDMYDEMASIGKQIHDSPCESGDVLSFYGNKKFFLIPNNPIKEEDLIYKAEKESRFKIRKQSQSFPTVASVASVRPSFILKNGRYPYDVFDELVVKAGLLLAEKKRKELNSPLPAIHHPSSNSVEDLNRGGMEDDKMKKSPSISSTIGSWFSKLATNSDKSFSSSSHDTFGSTSATVKRKRGLSFTGDVSLRASQSTDMLSMYSNVSSLATGKTNSSDEQLYNIGKATPSTENISPSKGHVVREVGSHIDGPNKKKKLLSPIELKYTSKVIDHLAFTTLFKVVIIPGESILKKVEKANISWSVATSTAYDKPLPKPSDDAVETLIEEMKYESLQSLENLNLGMDQLRSPEPLTRECNSKYNPSHDSIFPSPDYDILGLSTDADEGIANGGDPEKLHLSERLNAARAPDDEHMQPSSSCMYSVNAGDMGLQVLARNKNMHLKTKMNKLSTLLRMFNKTVSEYHEYMNFLDHESLFLEFEVRAAVQAYTANYIGAHYK